MALLKWGQEDEEKKNLFNMPSVQPIQSVQSTWQPAQDGSDIFDQNATKGSQEPNNYLMSQEKANIDTQLRQRKEAEAEAVRQAEARRIANETARARAAAAEEAETTTSKYVQPQDKDEGFWGFVKGIGAGIQQGFGALGDIAIQGGGALGSIGKSDEDLIKHVENVEKIRSWLHGGKDIVGNNFVGTRDVEEQASRIAAGQGDFQDIMAVGGKGLQAGIDSTMFLNPARVAVAGIPTKVAPASASLISRVSSNPTVRFAARDAGFFGGLQGGASTMREYGETGDWGQAFETGVQDATIGALLQGSLDVAGSGLNFAANRTLNSLRQPRRGAGGIEDIIESGERLTPTTQNERRGRINESGAPNDTNVSFESRLNESDLGQPSDLFENARVTPVIEGLDAPRVDGAPISEVDPRASQIENMTPVRPQDTPVVEPPQPVADGAVQPSNVVPAADPKTPTIRSDEIRNLQEARAGASQADEAVINQRLRELNPETPGSTQNLPDDMAGAEIPDPTTVSPRQTSSERLMPKLDDNADIKRRVANAVDMGKDAESPIRDILREGNVKPKQAERISTLYDDLETQLRDYNAAQEANQKAYREGGTDALSEDVSRQRSRVARDMGKTQRRLIRAIDKLEGSRDMKIRMVNGLVEAIGTRNANVLTSAGLIERNITQELLANAKLFLKNPVRTTQSTFGNGNILKDTAKGELSNWGDAPNSVPGAVKYIVGNTYRTAMIPTTALANTRRGMYRDELTKWAYKELEGRDLSTAEAHKLAGTAGNEMEALVNTFIGVDNGMTNRGQATQALKAWKEYIKTGDTGAKAEFLKKVEAHSSLADQMIAGLSRSDANTARGVRAIGNLIFPFVRTAKNLMKTTVQQDLNPFARSLLDEIRVDQRTGGQNTANLIKSKLIDYGVMSGAVALAGSGVLAYNDGDEVDKPRGWSIKIGENEYVPIRATNAELPIAIAGASQQIAEDIANGKPRDWKHYAGMITGSLPYIDQFNQTTGAIDSLTNGEDGGYAAKSFGVNMTKSFTPFSNNSVQPFVEGKQGKSTNAKVTYDENIFNWLYNTIRASYDPEFRGSLRDSRDAAGRVRTVDNQGFISNKDINDASTAMFNDDVSDLVAFARESGLGDGTQEMFNTYDTGKNNNFKSIQDSITFLDADGKPDNAKKLEVNDKISNLAQQIRDGFFGDTGSELLTLDGKNLYSDVSVPGKYGGKNTRLPISMESIKNAIAQTDLPEDQRTALYEIGQQKEGLFERRKAGEITWEQEKAMRSQIAQQEQALLQNSESYQKMLALMNELDSTGFFDDGGIGSTKSGQTFLWNSLNALLGSKGATPATQYPEAEKGFGGGGNGKRASNKPGDRGSLGLQWTPVKARQMASVKRQKFTPVKLSVKLGNEVRRNKTQNYSDRTI